MRFTIRNKLFLGFGALLALMLTASLLALANIASISDDTATMHEDVLPNVEMLGTLKSDALAFRNEQAKHIGETDPAALEQIQANLAAYKETMAGNFAELEGGDEDAGLAEETEALWQKYVDESATGIAASRAGDRAKATSILLAVGEEFFVPFEKSLDEWRDGRARGGEGGVRRRRGHPVVRPHDHPRAPADRARRRRRHRLLPLALDLARRRRDAARRGGHRRG